MAIDPNNEATVGVRIVTTEQGSAAAAQTLRTNLASMNTSAEVLMQQQMARERQVEQMLMQQGIRPSPGVGSLATKDLRALGLSEAQLATLGGPRVARGALGTGALGWEERRALSFAPGIGQFSGMLGMSGGMMALGGGALAASAAAAGVGDLVKDYRDHEFAVRDVTAAYKLAGLNVDQASASIEKWIDKNAGMIDDVNAAREGFATLTRTGLDQTQVTTAMNDAVDLAALKHIKLSQAVELVTLLTQGSSKGLRDLGVQAKDYTDLTITGAEAQKQMTAAHDKVSSAGEALANAQRALAEDQQRLHDKGWVTENDRMHEQDLIEKVNDAQQKLTDAQANAKTVQLAVTNRSGEVSQALADLHKVLPPATQDTDALAVAQHKFGVDMDKIATDVGPAMLTALSGIVSALDGAAQFIHALFAPGDPRYGTAHHNSSGGRFSGLQHQPSNTNVPGGNAPYSLGSGPGGFGI